VGLNADLDTEAREKSFASARDQIPVVQSVARATPAPGDQMLHNNIQRYKYIRIIWRKFSVLS
jgi:hypothetical protein